MNTKAVKWAWTQKISNKTTHHVLLGLAILSNNIGAVKASQNRLMKECDVSRSTLIRHLNALEDDGYIKRLENYCTNGRRAVNTYYLQFGEAYKHVVNRKEPSFFLDELEIVMKERK